MAKQRRNRHKSSALWGNRSAHRGVRLFRGSIGQSLSALSASSLKNVSAVSSSHSLSEAMLLLSLSLLRLVSSEHFSAPPSVICGWRIYRIGGEFPCRVAGKVQPRYAFYAYSWH